MANAEFRIFLSAVSSEFRSARNELTDDFGARDVLVRVQEQFVPGRRPHTLLAALDDYIRGCTIVICAIGRRSGACPTPEEAAPFVHMLPDGIPRASYTQWEYFLARHYDKECLLYIAQDAYEPDEATPHGDNFPDLQRDFVERIKRSGLHYEVFATTDALCRAAGRHRWPERTATPSAATRKPIVLPYPSLGTLFKGRDAFLRRLRESLARPNGAAAIAGRAVHGLGGVGKTRAAVEYAWTYRADYAAVFLVDAETGEKLHTGLAALTVPLQLPALADPNEATQMQAALAWLNANPGWLMILDNVDGKEALPGITELLTRLTGGHVLLAGRLSTFPAAFAVLDLDVSTPEDAAVFLVERTNGRRHTTPTDAAEADALGRELGQLALALEQAGAYICETFVSLHEYRILLRDSFDIVMRWADPAVMLYPRAVAATWQTSVARLGPEARRLLGRLAYMAPDPLPMTLLDVQVPLSPDGAPRRALADLAAYSLVAANPDARTFAVHRLLQDVTRRGMAAEAQRPTATRHWLQRLVCWPQRIIYRDGRGATPPWTPHLRLVEALGWLNVAFMRDSRDVQHWPLLDPLAPHVETVIAHADAAGIAEPTGRLVGALGSLYHARALYIRAEPLKRRALAIGSAGLNNNKQELATRLNNLATLLMDMNRLGEAEPLFPRALAIDDAIFGKDHPSTVATLSNLARLLQATNQLGEAERLFRRCLAIIKVNGDSDYPGVATILGNLAVLLQHIGQSGEAEQLLRRALIIEEATLGKRDPKVAYHLNNLGMLLLQDTNRHDEAETVLRHALTIVETRFGEDHPAVAAPLNNLAELLRMTNRFDEAEPLIRRSLAIDDAIRGSGHPIVANRLNNLAVLLRDTGRLHEVEPLMRRALAIFEESLGKDHPDVAIALNNLACLLQPDKAEPLLRRALDIDEASLGKDHPNVAIRLINLAAMLQATNRLGAAEPLIRRALAIFLAFQRDTGQAHPHGDAAIGNYINLLAAMGQSEAQIEAAIAALWREVGLDQG